MDNNFIKILDIKISTLKKVDILELIKDRIVNNIKTFIATPNPEFLLESLKNEKFKNILNNTDINIPDGVGLLFASKFLKTNPTIKERISGSDLFLEIVKISKDLDKKIFLLGGNSEDQLEIVKQNLTLNPQLSTLNMYSNIGFTKEEFSLNSQSSTLNPEAYPSKKNDALIKKINNSEAEIIFVAFGAPKQEYWISENINKLENIKLAIGIGGTLDFISGYKKRSPVWMQKLALEWLYRLIQEPSRLKRIINAVIIFPIKVIKSKL